MQNIKSLINVSLFSQHVAAIAYDSISVIDQAMDDLRVENNNMFHKTFRRGKLSNRGQLGVNCDAQPIVPWKHGSAIYRALQRVRDVTLA